MPCHAGTFSVSDPTTLITLIIFGFGLIITFGFIYSAVKNSNQTSTETSEHEAAPSASKSTSVIKSLFWDALLQRRLYRRSKTRWFTHALIFYPFVFRFIWGISALWFSNLTPEWQGIWHMLDKNNPVTAICFDISGLMLLVGIGLALLRPSVASANTIGNYPRQDRLALILIGGTVLIGFFVEGLRISMTQFPSGAEYAFVGYLLASLFRRMTGLTEFYPYVRYVPCLFYSRFFIYLPFSR